MHYAHPLDGPDDSGLALTYTRERPDKFAGIFLLLRSFLRIPPGMEAMHGDVSCRVPDELTFFAFRLDN